MPETGQTLDATGHEQPVMTVRASDFTAPLVQTPFPLQGSKKKLVPLLKQLVPADTCSVVEPFCGSAAVSLGLSTAFPALGIHINDLNPDIANLWQAIVDDPATLAEGYEKIWEGQYDDPWAGRDNDQYFLYMRSQINEAGSTDPAHFLYMLHRIVKGALRYNSQAASERGRA